MPLDPDAAKLLDLLRQQNAPPMETLTPDEARVSAAASAALSADPGAEVSSVEEREIGGVPNLVVTPIGIDQAGSAGAPVLVWFHGGGWVIGSAEQSLHTARDLAAGAGCVVVVPDYRLAPEHPFPAAFDDALAVTRSVVDQAGQVSGDPARIAVGGDSAGGNLAAVAALEVGGLVHQLLAYPVIDATMSRPSYRRVPARLPTDRLDDGVVRRLLCRRGRPGRPQDLAYLRHRRRPRTNLSGPCGHRGIRPAV